jgi:hypoxanthine-DNA glycosylase
MAENQAARLHEIARLSGRIVVPSRWMHAALRSNGIAVWDVLKSCRRVGSLDSAVEPDSMVPNDFGELFDAHPAITRVLFNGAAAEKNFNRFVRVAPDLHYRRLPSTSPAQTMRYEDKLTVWREAITARQ